MSATRFVDVCGLAPPEPMERILEALRTLPQGETLRVHIHRQPYPLYDLLAREGYACATAARDDGTFELTIRHTG